MTRTDVMASSRPRTAGAKTKGPRAWSRLAALPVAALVALALIAPGTALGANEPTSGYSTTTPAPPVTTTTPSTGTSPSKEEGTPTATTSKETTPTTTSTPAKETAKALPFTGFDLRWSFAIGLVLIAGGLSIVVMQRRREHGRR